MLIKDHVAAFMARREPSGLFLDGDGVVKECLIAAVRFYAGWADLVDTTAAAGLELIDENTDLTAGEWGILSPLFFLYIEREEARAIESSRQSGVMEMIGRTSSEIAGEIAQAEASLPQLAYVEDVVSVGLPEA